MRHGHKWSGGFEKGFQADAEVEAVLVTVPQGQLVDEHGAERPALGVEEPFGRHLSVAIEDALELLVQIFDGSRAQLVKDATYVHSIIGVRVGAAPSGHDDAVLLLTPAP